MSEKTASESTFEHSGERLQPPILDLDVGLEAGTIAYMMELTGEQSYVKYRSDPLQEKTASEAYTAHYGGMLKLIESNTARAREVMDIMATGSDWQKELSAYLLGHLLEQEHKLGNTHRKLIAANHLVRIMHEEQRGKISPEVLSRIHGKERLATKVMTELVGMHGVERIEDGSTRWLDHDIKKWFERELLAYLSESDIYD